MRNSRGLKGLVGALVIVVGLALLAPLSAQADVPPAASRVVELFSELGAALDAAKGDCDKVAEAVNAWTVKNGAEMKKLSELMDPADDSMTPEEMKALEAELAPTMNTLIESVMQCADHDGVEKAFQAMDAALGGAKEEAAPAKGDAAPTPPPAAPSEAKTPPPAAPVK